jgi:hypothetical protein
MSIIEYKTPLKTQNYNKDDPYHVKRVRQYLERNLGCSRKEMIENLNLNRRTIIRAIAIIRQQLKDENDQT